jgi:predicted nucleic acid-binding protein
MSGGRVFFDTNVFVYLFDADAPAKQDNARKLVAELGRAGQIALSPQVLQEFYVTVTRKLARPLAPPAARAAVTHLSTFAMIAVDGSTVLRAVHLHQTASLSFWDALIVQAALEGNCKTLYSEDLQAGRSFGGLEIENPLASAAN